MKCIFQLLKFILLHNLLKRYFPKCGPWTLGGPHDPYLLGVHEIKIIHIIKLRHYVPLYCVDICTDGREAVVGKLLAL